MENQIQPEEDARSNIKKLLDTVINHGIKGIGPVAGSEELAGNYRDNEKYRSTDEKVNALIRWESSKSFGAGFISGLGGLVTLPVAVPASIYATWVSQARMAGAIASLYRYNLESDRVKTFILVSLIGDSAKEILKSAGIKSANTFTANLIKKIPGSLLKEINKKIGFELLTKAGSKGTINLARAVPVAGGLVSGIIDAASVAGTGKIAKSLFRKGKTRGSELFITDSIGITELNSLIKEAVNDFERIDISQMTKVSLKLKRMPIPVEMLFRGFSEGFITFKISGNPLVKSYLRFKISRSIKKITTEYMDYIKMDDYLLVIDINGLLKKSMGHITEVKLKNLEINEGGISLEFE